MHCVIRILQTCSAILLTSLCLMHGEDLPSLSMAFVSSFESHSDNVKPLSLKPLEGQVPYDQRVLPERGGTVPSTAVAHVHAQPEGMGSAFSDAQYRLHSLGEEWPVGRGPH